MLYSAKLMFAKSPERSKIQIYRTTAACNILRMPDVQLGTTLVLQPSHSILFHKDHSVAKKNFDGEKITEYKIKLYCGEFDWKIT